MSGMKFRLHCAGCGATFFAPDRKTRHCSKCAKKRVTKKETGETKPEVFKSQTGRFGFKPGGALNKERKPRSEPKTRPPKASELTPELTDQIARIYQEQFTTGDARPSEIIAQISDKLWLQRKLVGSVVNRLILPDAPITPEIKERIIETYRGYVVRSERPAGGRRRAIADAIGIPLRQVRSIVYEWSRSQYAQSPSPELSREQRFEVEKAYWDELSRKRHRYDELPERIVERLGYITAYQVARWLDTLHDDQSKFENVADPPPELEERILEAYQRYLAAPQPPEKGLHSTIASQIGGVSGRQVHKVLQRFRNSQRDEYPLK